MDPRPLFGRDAMISLYDEPLYDEAAARELLMCVGRPRGDPVEPKALAFSLNEIGKAFAFGLWNEVQASTPLREKGAKRLAAACQNVLRIAGVADGGELLPMFGRGGLFAAASIRGEARGEAATMNALHAVDLLRRDALAMLEREGRSRRMKKPKAGRPDNLAMQRLVRDLSCLYESGWQQTPGVSNGASVEPSGPLMRLMRDVTERVSARGLRFSRSASALRSVWQRLPDEDKMPLTAIEAKFEAHGKASEPLPQ